jgi:hypothetical protein
MTSRTHPRIRAAAIGNVLYRWANSLYRRWVVHRDKMHVRTLPDSLLDDIGLHRDTIDRALQTGHRPGAPCSPRMRRRG